MQGPIDMGEWARTDRPKSNYFFMPSSCLAWPCIILKKHNVSFIEEWRVFFRRFSSQVPVVVVVSISLHWVPDCGFKTQNIAVIPPYT